jgi:Fe-S-cluster containining protein
MCCNGVLFGDVELQRGDDAKQLAKAGIDVFRKGRKQAFAQPCACFDGKLCRIYADRPNRCVSFECGLLKRVAQDDITAAAALKTIRATRRQADTVLKLVRELGNHDEAVPLNKRYAAVIAQPIDLSAAETEVELRGELMMAVAELAGLIEREFLTNIKS